MLRNPRIRFIPARLSILTLQGFPGGVEYAQLSTHISETLPFIAPVNLGC